DNRGDAPVTVEMGMADETGYSHTGKVVSGDVSVDPSTATYGVRAQFDNVEKTISAGLYVRLRLVLDTSEALLVPDAAVQADQRGQFVMIVNNQGLAERRTVMASTQLGAYRRITEGLSIDDRVIVNGIQRAQPGAPVKPMPAEAPPLPPIAAEPPTTQPATAPATQTAATEFTPTAGAR
ncbi:MAG TPA: efflux RND transporter periplasmic adaptor subunit, partial [Tepidisphaeraceae bacterium]